MTTLYPAIEPFRRSRLKVSDLHEIYIEECGNPSGPAALFVHGGPGGGTEAWNRQFFDPRQYRIILFDQRGCGNSTPHAELRQNTTWDLVADMERIREALAIEQWLLFGGSWGSTLSLSYATKFPQRVAALILRGIFLLRQAELRWFYQDGCNWLYPDKWETYRDAIPLPERGNFIDAYYRRLTSSEASTRTAAARAWSLWEAHTSKLMRHRTLADRYGNSHFAEAFARIECHYFVNGGFFPYDGWLLDQIPLIRHIPAVIVQGRYDVVCPMRSAWDLHRCWPEAEFHIVPDAGHAASESGTLSRLVDAANRLIHRF